MSLILILHIFSQKNRRVMTFLRLLANRISKKNAEKCDKNWKA